MVGDKKRPRDAPPHKPRQWRGGGDDGGDSSKAAAPRAAPSFVSSLQNEEGDFPRGGGTSLTAFEMKQVREEGRREADEEAAAEASSRPAKKPKRQQSERERKREKKNIVKVHEHKEGQIRVEHLNYKRLVPGTRVLARVHTVLPLHLILSLPNNLLAHVPITEISSTLTKLLSAEQDAMSVEGESDEEEKEEENEDKSAPELGQLFAPGQYFTAKVLNLFPTASQSFISQYPVTETTRLAARLEATLVPEKVNAEVVKADLSKGYVLVGEVKEEEDKGWRVGLGLGEDAKDVEGWLGSGDVKKHAGSLIPGQLVRVAIAGSTAGGRVMQLTLDPQVILKSQLSEVNDVASILPGQQASVLVTAVAPNGLNVKVCGFFDGTIDFAHLGLGEEDIELKFRIGSKIRARILYDNLAVTPRRFGLSVLPHILDLKSPTTKDGTPLEEAVPIGKVLHSVTVQRVMQEWGLLTRTDDGMEGFVHISHISDKHVPSLSSSLGPYKPGTLHRARVIGHSPLDGVVLLSLEQKVLDQVFMTVDELKVGQQIRGTVHRLSDKAMFVNINGSVHGVVWPNHYADIQLKHPEKRFKVGGAVKARVWEIDAPRSRVVLTLKRSLVDSDLEIPQSALDVKRGQITPAVVSKILDKGCLVDLFGGLRAFVPQSEASQSFITDLRTIFSIGKPVNVRITEIQADGRIVASARQALPSAVAAEQLEVGSEVTGQVSQIHSEQVVVTLVPSLATALLSLSNLSNHRHMGVDELRQSLKVGDKLEDLIIVMKNPTSGLYIVSNKKEGQTAPMQNGSGVSKQSLSYDTLEMGQQVSGRVITHTAGAAVVLLASHVKAKLHPCDVADDYDQVKLGLDGAFNVDERVNAQVIKVNPHARIVDLSTRPSRNGKDAIVKDAEINSVNDLKVGQKVRGFIKNVVAHGLFVSLGRNVHARVMIKELFDDYIKEWQSYFTVHQLVEGKIISINTQTSQVEMSFKKKDSKGKGEKAKLSLSDFVEGQVVVASVKKVETFGMFLVIEDSDVSGLCHKSEIADSKKADVAQALQGFRPGDQVKAKILSIDAGTKKVNFGIKASYFAENGEEEEDEGMDSGAEENDEEDAQEDEEDDDDDDENVIKLGEESDDEDEGALARLLGAAQQSGEGSADEEDEEDDEEEEDDDEDEDGEDDEEDDEDEDEGVDIDVDTPAAASSKAKNSAPIPSLNVAGGFNWTNGNGADADAESDSDSDSSDEEAGAPAATAKGKGKAKAKLDLTAGAADESQPESTAEFERALLASPNSSFLWIQYMSFLLQLHEIDRARKIGRQALDKIAYREEAEKLNVWMALVNLELGFGTQEGADAVFKEAAQYNDARTVYTRYAEALVASDKLEPAEEVLGKLAKKFSAYPESWTRFAEFYLKKGDKKAARGLLTRATKSLDKSKHVELLKAMAILECKYDDVERGKTMFEGLLDRAPKRLDLWNVYIDQMAKTGDIQTCRALIERALDRKLTAKKAKFLFKKWISLEDRIGDDAGQEQATVKAREWVAANAAAEDEEDSE